MKQVAFAFCASVLLVGSLIAQESHSGVLIPGDRVQEAVRSMPATGVKDAAMRVVQINGEYNVGVSVVRRMLVNGKPPVDALQHHAITEVYQVTQGCGTLQSGGELVGAKELERQDKDIIAIVGPSARGTAIRGATSQHVSVGDLVIIPPDTPHGFADICPEGITYTLVRVDPKRVLAVK